MHYNIIMVIYFIMFKCHYDDFTKIKNISQLFLNCINKLLNNYLKKYSSIKY